MSSTLAVELDDARLSRSAPGMAKWRWENVEKAPQWVSGARPRYNFLDRLDVIELAPGDSTTFRVPKRGAIRVVRLDGKLAAGDLQIWVSNGSGLYRHLLSGINRSDGSLVAVPDASRPSLARVVRTGSSNCPVRIAVYTSRFLAPEFIEGYRCEIEGCGESHALADSRMGPRKSSEYYMVTGKRPARIAVKGPARLELATHYVYEDADRATLQPYRVYAHRSGAPRRVLEFDTTSEQRMHVHVDGCERLVGARKVAYLDVPAGDHTFEFAASTRVFLQARLLNCKIYRRSQYNSPVYFPREQRVGVRPETYSSIWQIPESDVRKFLRFDPTDATAQAGLALRSVRDNRYQQGGLRAAMMMMAASAGRPSEPTVRQFADHLLNSRTVYRNLLPQWQDQGVIPRFAFFNVRSLRSPKNSHIDVIVGEQLVGDTVSHLTSGQFLPVGSCWANAGHYPLPKNLGPSLLRVVIDESSLRKATRICVQYDERSPILLDASPKCDLALGQFNPTRGETALAAMNEMYSPYDSGTVGGPFAAHNDKSAPLISAGSSELLIPPGVRAVRVWATGELAERPRIALQFRASKHYRLTEAGYCDSLQRADLMPGLLFDSLINELEPACRDGYSYQEIRNHWVPLVRMMRQTHAKVMAKLELPKHKTQRGPDRAATRDELETAETARQLALHDQWLPALEAWSTLVNSPQEGLRREAVLQRAKALESLHEESLAKNELMGTFFAESDDLLLKQLAYDELIGLFTRLEDLGGLEHFLIAATVECSSTEYLYDLSQVFLAKGRFRHAILVGLMTPDPTRIRETMLRATYHEGWWRTFDRFVRSLDAQPASLWTALKQIKQGKLSEAKQGFATAGSMGQAWLEHLRIGESILDKLSEADATNRACAVHAWEAWQAHHPGPRTWREEGALVAECPGTASVYSVGRDVYGQFYAADPGSPLRLVVHGPVDLKLEVRPLHPTGAIEPQDDWLSIESKDAAAIVPITSNRPDVGFEIVGSPETTVGKSVAAYYRVGPGRHEIAVSAEHARVLLRVSVLRPELPLTVLPPINDATLIAIEQGEFRKPKTSEFYWKRNLIHPRHDMVAHLLRTDCSEAAHLPFLQFGPHALEQECSENRRADSCSSDCSLCQRIDSRRTGEPTCGSADLDCTSTMSTGTHLPVESFANTRDWDSFEESPWRIQMQHLAAADLQGALRVPCDTDLMAVRQRMAVLAYVAEKNPALMLQGYAEATRLLNDHPLCSGLDRVRSRIATKAAWKLLREYDASAGIHTLEVSEWLPELPSLRVRRSMLGMRPTGDALLTGSQQLVLDVRNTEASAFNFVLKRPRVGYLVGRTMQIVCQVDGQPQRVVDLPEPGTQRQLHLELTAGQHRVRFWHADPLLDHFVLLTIREDGEPNSTPSSYSIAKRNRTYQVATHDEPIRFRVPGPATIRIDELRGKRTFTSLDVVDMEGREFILRPLSGETSALFRVWEMRHDADRQRLQGHVVDIVPPSVPESWLENSIAATGGYLPLHEDNSEWFAPGGYVPGAEAWGDPLSLTSLLPPDGNAPWLALDDQWKLGQEDGTTAFHVGRYDRRALEEAERVGLPDQFNELGMTRYEYDPWNHKYWKTERVVRIREKGGRSSGVAKTCRFTLPPRWTWIPRQMQGLWGSRDPWVKRYPVNVAWTAKGFVQQSESTNPRVDGDLQWSAFATGQLTRKWQITCKLHHTPSVSIFRRMLSLDGNPYAPGEIDQDVYTEFKNDHRFGYIFKDRFVYEPTLDRRWWLEPSFYSNEDFRMDRPDHMSVRVGHSRLAGPLYLDGSYRYARYFKDSDRDAYATQHLVYLQSRLGGWFDSGNRVELASGISHDITGNRSSVYMRLIWFHSRGRGADDFHPNDMPFLPLQKQNALPAWFDAGGFSDI